jgi:hypothetical protein
MNVTGADFGNVAFIGVNVTGVDFRGVKVGDAKFIRDELRGDEGSGEKFSTSEFSPSVKVTCVEVAGLELAGAGLVLVEVAVAEPVAVEPVWADLPLAELCGVPLPVEATPARAGELPSQKITISKGIAIRLICALLQLLWHDLPLARSRPIIIFIVGRLNGKCKENCPSCQTSDVKCGKRQAGIPGCHAQLSRGTLHMSVVT